MQCLGEMEEMRSVMFGQSLNEVERGVSMAEIEKNDSVAVRKRLDQSLFETSGAKRSWGKLPAPQTAYPHSRSRHLRYSSLVIPPAVRIKKMARRKITPEETIWPFPRTAKFNDRMIAPSTKPTAAITIAR